MSNKFIGRTEELKLLRGLFDKNSASLVAIYGRRRIGKSRLIEEFGKNTTLHTFTGLPPEPRMTAKSQLNEFSRQMARNINRPTKMLNDWGDAFEELALCTQNGRIIILLDEITWLSIGDPDFLGKLKNAWDNHFKKNDQLILVLCGSVSSWIKKWFLWKSGG